MRSTRHLKRNSMSFDPHDMAVAASAAATNKHCFPIDELMTLAGELETHSLSPRSLAKAANHVNQPQKQQNFNYNGKRRSSLIDASECKEHSPSSQIVSAANFANASPSCFPSTVSFLPPQLLQPRRRNSYAAESPSSGASQPSAISRRPLPASPSASSFVTYLCPPSPTSAYGKNKPNSSYNSQHRRNSYAAPPTIPENFNDNNDKNSSGDMMTTSGSSSRSDHFLDPNMAAACRRRLPPTPNKNNNNGSISDNFAHIGSSENCSPIIRRGSSPRVLPSTPTSIPAFKGDKSPTNTSGGSFDSKYSSPEINVGNKPLPRIHTDNCISFEDLRSAEDLSTNGNSKRLERRPSSGRRLPLPPTAENSSVNHNELATWPTIAASRYNNSSEATLHRKSDATTYIASYSKQNHDSDEPTILQRSASTRQPSNRSSSQITPASSARCVSTPQNNELNRLTRTASSSSAATPCSSATYNDHIAEKVARAISRHSSREKSIAITILPPRSTSDLPPLTMTANTRSTVSSLSANETGDSITVGRRMPTLDIGITLHAPLTTMSSSATLQKPSISAPQSPRSDSLAKNSCFGGSQHYDETTHLTSSLESAVSSLNTFSFASGASQTTKSTSSGSVCSTVVHTPARKHSDAFENSIGRNGSMAFLLEQQHILRREFNTAQNECAATGGPAYSNSSSLSPSMERLNCGTGSKSGSDAEEVMNGGNSPSCSDARMHGIDPSLYMAGGAGMTNSVSTNSASSYSFHDAAATNGSSSGGARDTSAGAGSMAVSASTSWFQQSGATTATTTTAGGAQSPEGATVAVADVIVQPQPSGLGLMHCTLQHFPVRKRLRVSVLKIEGLAGQLKPELEILPFCKVNLLPGKQKQSGVVKRGRDAVFNQEFFFDGVATEELESKTLSIEVCHQSVQKLQKDLSIGEIFVPLKDLTQLHSKKEVRIVEELKYSVNSKKLGKIYLTTCIEKEARRLTINIIKVDDLPKWGIIGAPDVCVRITLAQGVTPPQTKSSRILKSTTSAVYKEAVMFLISTKKSDLQHTRITISVHDLSRSTTGNDVIGSVYLGELAIDKSEIDQWRQTVDHWGKEYKGVHHLKLNHQNAPDVHVSEAQSDTEEVQ